MCRKSIYNMVALVGVFIFHTSTTIGQTQLTVNDSLPIPSSSWLSSLSGHGSQMQSVILGGALMIEPNSQAAFLVNPALVGRGSSIRTNKKKPMYLLYDVPD